MRTLNVNLFAGPGAGKTTCAHIICAELRKRGYAAEYVAQEVKECVWREELDMLDGSLQNQSLLYMRQKERLRVMQGKVDVAVTDSPAIMSTLYLNNDVGNKERENFALWVKEDFVRQENFNVFIEREDGHHARERVCAGKQALALDEKIKKMLKQNGFFFGVYTCNTIDSVCIDNIIKTLARIREQP